MGCYFILLKKIQKQVQTKVNKSIRDIWRDLIFYFNENQLFKAAYYPALCLCISINTLANFD